MSGSAGRIAAALMHAQVGGFLATPPGLDGQPGLGLAGIQGVPRAREWDAVGSADAPDLTGDEVHFVALADGTLVVDEDVPDGSLAPLADALERHLEPPYAALGVRQGDGVWTAAALRVAIAELAAGTGDTVEAGRFDGEETVSVDGEPVGVLPPPLERLAAAVGQDWSLRAERIDDTLWLVDVKPL